MSHHSDCLCSNPSYGHYATCTCESLFRQDHTEALTRAQETHTARASDLDDLRARVDELERRIELIAIHLS